MTLKLKDIEVECIIGERPEEREVPQTLHVDVEFVAPARAAVSDNINDAVDYAELSENIRAALVAAKCRLIERAAKVVYDLLPTKNARVSVTKVGAVAHLGAATVEYP